MCAIYGPRAVKQDARVLSPHKDKRLACFCAADGQNRLQKKIQIWSTGEASHLLPRVQVLELREEELTVDKRNVQSTNGTLAKRGKKKEIYCQLW